jgi:hypothetical protein
MRNRRVAGLVGPDVWEEPSSFLLDDSGVEEEGDRNASSVNLLGNYQAFSCPTT